MADTSRNTSWHGSNREAPDVQHRWASGGQEMPNGKSFTRTGIPKWRIGTFLVVALAATAVLVFSLSYYPKRTPLVSICLRDYAWPLPPNAGVTEDLNGLQLLDNMNLDVEDISDRWKNKQAGLLRLGEYINEVSIQGKHRGPIVVYVNGHGAVDHDGEPCLLLPGYDPMATDQWLRMRHMIDTIQSNINAGTEIVLIVDCVKSRRNWRFGVLVNTWQQRMKTLVEELALDNLQVIASVGEHQVNEYSSELAGTTFGHYLRLGLAGFSDRQLDLAQFEWGQGDGQVSLRELVKYLQDNVAKSALESRGDLQLPQLLSSSSKDLNLTTSLNRQSMLAIKNTRELESSQSVSLDDLSLLWGKLDRIKTPLAYRLNPQQIHYFENQLLYLEQLRSGGKGYASATTQLFQKLEIECDRVLQKSMSVSDLISGSGDGSSLGTLRVNRKLGLISDKEWESLQQEFMQISSDNRQSPLLVGERTGQPQIQESFLSGWLNQLNVASVWPSTVLTNRFAKMHLQSELAGIPDDIRIHAWSIGELEQADLARRKAFDLMFAGDPATEQAMNQAEALYSFILSNESSVQNRIRALYENLDRVTSEYVGLAKWHTRWNSPMKELDIAEWQADLGDRKLMLNDLASRLRNQTIDLAQPSLSRDDLNLSESNREIERLYGLLSTKFKEHYETLLSTSTMDGVLIFELKEVLKSSSIPAQKRKELLEKLRTAQIAVVSREQDSRAEITAATIDILQDRLSGESESQIELTTNPLIAFLDVSTDDLSGDSPLDSLAKISERLAMRLKRLSKRDFLMLASEDKLTELNLAGVAKTRGLLNFSSFLQRQSLGLLETSKVDSNLIGELARFEMQQALFWLANRCQLDFYGRRPDMAQNSLDADFTFESIAKGLYKQGAALYPDTPSLEKSIAANVSKLNQLAEKARRAISLTVESELQLDQGSDSELTVRLKSNSIAAEQGIAQISGSIALRLQSTGNEKWTTGFRADYPIPEPGMSRQWKVASQLNSKLVAFFRGHEFQTSVLLKSLGGHTVTIDRPENRSSQVTLLGDKTGPSSVMFILDCSQSMAETIRTELIGNEEVPRLDFAKGVLGTMMSELGGQKDTRVGVRFFGHRSGWSTSQPSVKLRQEAYQGKFPDLLVPENDVELALPVGRFTMVEADKIKKQMESIKPWGQSPINLALIQAMNDFEFEPEGTQKSIVVITDGLNYQFTPNTDTTANPRITTLTDVVAQIESKKVPIYILGFGISDEDKKEAENNFFSIANKSGGKYFAVNSGKELLQTMRNQLQLGTYRVYSSAETTSPVNKNRLTRLYDSVGLARPGNYRVVSDSADLNFFVEGGEALQFQLTDGPTIAGIPYQQEQIEVIPLGHKTETGRMLFRAHRPTREGDSVEFKFSFQFANQAFTPRPQEVWVRITPSFQENELPVNGNTSYVFYDRVFPEKTPVPVLNCKVASWPGESKSADVEVFCKYQDTLPNQSIPLKSWMASLDKGGDYREVEGIPGLRFRVETDDSREGNSMIRIIEEHDRQSEGIYSVKIGLATASNAKPARIVRQFDTENNVGVHSFYFDPRTFERVIDSEETAIQFFTKQNLKANSWTQKDLLNFRVFPALELLPLDATTGDR